MEPPRRRVVIFKGGGYIYSDLEGMIKAAGVVVPGVQQLETARGSSGWPG
jgi:hypothetical protein